MNRETSMNTKTPLGPSGRPYSHALDVAGGKHMVFVSGQLARADPEHAHHPGDLGRQALLREAGGSLADVVKITAFLTTLDGYADYSAIRREVFADPLPASSTVQVSSLVTPGCLIEIEAIAIL